MLYSSGKLIQILKIIFTKSQKKKNSNYESKASIARFLIIKYYIGANAFEWDYTVKGPDAWPYAYPACKGALQSPINLNSNTSLPNTNLKDINFYNYDKVLAWNMTNNGHTRILFICSSANNMINTHQ
jgi:carbonic anhydrase